MAAVAPVALAPRRLTSDEMPELTELLLYVETQPGRVFDFMISALTYRLKVIGGERRSMGLDDPELIYDDYYTIRSMRLTAYKLEGEMNYTISLDVEYDQTLRQSDVKVWRGTLTVETLRRIVHLFTDMDEVDIEVLPEMLNRFMNDTWFVMIWESDKNYIDMHLTSRIVGVPEEEVEIFTGKIRIGEFPENPFTGVRLARHPAPGEGWGRRFDHFKIDFSGRATKGARARAALAKMTLGIPEGRRMQALRDLME